LGGRWGSGRDGRKVLHRTRRVNSVGVEGATGKLLLQQMVAVAELEPGSCRPAPRAALAAAKRRGVKLRGDRGARLTAKQRAAGRAVLMARARKRAQLRAAGCGSLKSQRASISAHPRTEGGQVERHTSDVAARGSRSPSGGSAVGGSAASRLATAFRQRASRPLRRIKVVARR
jgi:hypothetical protein